MTRRSRVEDRPPSGAAGPFVVECPRCRAYSAVGVALVGRHVGCPVCRGSFVVPSPATAEAPPAESSQPPHREPQAGMAPAETPPQRPVAGEPAVAAVSTAPGQESSPTEAATDAAAPIPASTPAAPLLSGDGSIAWSEPPPPSTRSHGAARPAPRSPAAPAEPVAIVPPSPADTPVPPVTDSAASIASAADDAPDGLALREPVKTIRVGGAEIELRRLSPEELRIRRGRRNLVILVVGAALLVALVVVLTSSRGGR